MKTFYPVKEAHHFNLREFIAGNPSIDFVNTVTGRNGAPRDWLDKPKALLSWAAKVDIISDAEAEQLVTLYDGRPQAGDAALAKAVEVREAMFLLLESATNGVIPPSQCVTTIEQAWLTATFASRVRWNSIEGLIASRDEVGMDLVVDRVVLEFVALGADLLSPRLRRCAGDNCAWFFIDTSKAGRRRWCDMATCGNAAKYARFRA